MTSCRNLFFAFDFLEMLHVVADAPAVEVVASRFQRSQQFILDAVFTAG